MTNSELEQSIADAREQADGELTRTMQEAAAAAAALDRTLLSLSGGALVLSMTFVGQFAASNQLLPLLFLSWVAFSISLVSVVFAMRAAQTQANRTASHISEVLQEIDKLTPRMIAKKGPVQFTREFSLARSVRSLNICAIIFFVLGVLLLGVFIGYNLWSS